MARSLRRPAAGHGVGGSRVGASGGLNDVEPVEESGDEDTGVSVSRARRVNDSAHETGNLDRFATGRVEDASVDSDTPDDQCL